MRKFRSKLSWKDVFFLLVIAKLIDSLYKCCKKKKTYNRAIKINRFEANFIKNQLIILKKEGVSEKDFILWQQENLGTRNIKQFSVCKKCDNNLQLWEGENIATFIVDKAAQGGIPPDAGGGVQGGGGEDEVAYFCYNVLIDLPEPVDCSPRIPKIDSRNTDTNSATGPALTIAVFDTGIIPQVFDDYIHSVRETCMPDGKKGWNFVMDNSTTDDDHKGKHGTLVSKFIIDQAVRFQKRRINILPVKVHNKNGQGNLFNILCAFAYAANSGAQLINASFGFYVKKTSAPPDMLTAFVKKHLTANNILMIAAAGNAHALEDSQFLAGQPPGYPEQKARDLDEHHFFPACLSKEFKHVLTVTTVYVDDAEASVSPIQNYSKNFVNVGVSCDQVQGDDYDFFNPLTGSQHPMISGSSYATPVITGIIAQHYNELIADMPNGVFDNHIVVEKLALYNLVKKSHQLQQAVEKGYYYKQVDL